MVFGGERIFIYVFLNIRYVYVSSNVFRYNFYNECNSDVKKKLM